ncbi:NTP reductase large subunit [Vibrio cholerae]|nr:anaerobic ribonucleoside-triphosphate reductase [Vibrio cholerae]PKQ51915.1 NTP reductase large subunit [Vibrio cholerae]
MKPIVIKRDGSKAPFNRDRIQAAVESAAEHADQEIAIYALNVALAVELKLRDYDEVHITEIQTLVENELMQGPYKALARSYIEYRHDRDVAREKQSKLTKEIEGLIQESNADLLNENANKDGKVIPTQRDLLAGIVAKHYAKTRILPRDVVQAHESGDIHYHDLDYAPFFPMFNCMLIDLKGMLTHGFKMGNAEIDTPKSISTATAVTAQIIAQVASHIYGGTTINRIDEVLAPYVTASYEKHLEIAREWDIHSPEAFAKARTEKECYDAFQSLEYEVNTLHTANGHYVVKHFMNFLCVCAFYYSRYDFLMALKANKKRILMGLQKSFHLAELAVFPREYSREFWEKQNFKKLAFQNAA